MSIHDFYQKFVVRHREQCPGGVRSRRLSLLDDPKAMFEGEPTNEWVSGPEAEPSWQA